MTKLGYCSIAVVGHCLYQHRNAVWSVSLVCDFVIGDALKLTGTTLDRAVDGVIGHIQSFRVVYGLAKTCVRVDVAAAPGSSGHCDLPDELRKDLAAFGIESAFFMLD